MSKNPEEEIEPFLDEDREREKRLCAALCLNLEIILLRLIVFMSYLGVWIGVV